MTAKHDSMAVVESRHRKPVRHFAKWRLAPAVAWGIFLLVLMPASGAYAGEAARYHGMKISRPFPPGYEPVDQRCIETESDSASGCDYGIHLADISVTGKEKVRAIFLLSNTREMRIVDYPAIGPSEHLIWQIEDSLEYPINDVLDYVDCTSVKYPRTQFVAFGKWRRYKQPKKGAYMQPVVKAWRVDAAKRKFVEIAGKDVRCVSLPDDEI